MGVPDRDVESVEVTRDELNRQTGPVMVEFGAAWCGICRAFAPAAARLRGEFPGVTHWKVEDGRGKPLGRSFRVTLWPTFVLMRDGAFVERLVRPEEAALRHALERLLTGVGEGVPSKEIPADESP